MRLNSARLSIASCSLSGLEKTRIGNQCRKKGGRNAENDSKIDAKQSGPDKYKGENRG